jgi:hypothetical protein
MDAENQEGEGVIGAENGCGTGRHDGHAPHDDAGCRTGLRAFRIVRELVSGWLSMRVNLHFMFNSRE